MKSQIGQENERLGSFHFAGRLKMMFKLMRSTLLPTSTFRTPKVERQPSNANSCFWTLSKDSRKFLPNVFWKVQAHFRTNRGLQVWWTWASESIICSLSTSSFWKVWGAWEKFTFFHNSPKLFKNNRDEPCRVWDDVLKCLGAFGECPTTFQVWASDNMNNHTSLKTEKSIWAGNWALEQFFYFRAFWEMISKLVRSTLLPTSILRVPMVEGQPIQRNFILLGTFKGYQKRFCVLFLNGSYSF